MKKLISIFLMVVMIFGIMPVAFGAVNFGTVNDLPSGWTVLNIESFTNGQHSAYADEDVTLWLYKEVMEPFNKQPITIVQPLYSDKDKDSFKGSGEYGSFKINRSADVYLSFGFPSFGDSNGNWDTKGIACATIQAPQWATDAGWESFYIEEDRTLAPQYGTHNGVLLNGTMDTVGFTGRITRPYKRTVIVPEGEEVTINLYGAAGGKNIAVPYVIFIDWKDNSEEDGIADWPSTQAHYMGYRMAQMKPADDYVCDQNPPNFIWHTLHGIGNDISKKALCYDLRIARDKEMTDIYKSVENIPEHFYTFSEPFEPGVYYWQVRYYKKISDTGEYAMSRWTEPLRFRIDEDAHKISLPYVDGKAVLAEMKTKNHPYYYSPKKIAEMIKGDAGKAVFATALKKYNGVRDALPEIDLEMVWSEGLGGTVVKDDFVQQMLNEGERLEALALVYAGTEDDETRQSTLTRGLETIDRIAQIKWPPWNSLTDQYIGEMIVHMAIGYDAFYNVMGDERVEKLKEDYGHLLELCSDNLFHAQNNTYNGFIADPTSSHQQRIGVEMIISALIFRDDVETTKEVYDFLLPLYINNYRTYTTDDGLYMNGIGYYSWRNPLDLADVLNFFDIADITKKSGYINEIDQSLYMWPVGSWGPFGDGSSSQYNIYQADILRKYYDTYNSPVARWMLEEGGLGLGTGSMFASTGTAEAEKPVSYSSSKYFKDAGLAGLHSDLTDKNRVSLFFRSSQWGAYNHSHADQNSFVIDAYGERLAIDSGHYPYYQSPHHHNYTRQTHAHNSITFGEGQGQNVSVIDSKGKITYFLNHPDFDLISGDATEAYRNPDDVIYEVVIDKFKRNIVYIRPDIFIVIDDLDAKGNEKSKFQFWLNAEESIDLTASQKGATIVKGKATLDAEVMYPEVSGEKLEGYMGYDRISWPKEKTQSATNEIDPNQGNQCRVYFETDEVSKTKMIITLDVHKTGETKRSIVKAEGDGYLKLTFEDGSIAYIQTEDNRELTVDGITFNGDAVVIKDGTVMLVNGTLLKMNGADFYKSDVATSMVFGKDEFSVSSIEKDATVELYDESIYTMLNKRYEFLRPVAENAESYGVNWTKNTDGGYSEFKLYNDNYRFYLNGKEMPGAQKNIAFSVFIDGVETKFYPNAYLEQDGVIRADVELSGIYGDFEIIENSGVNLPKSGNVFFDFDEVVETEGLNPYIKLRRLDDAENSASIIELDKADGKVTARAFVENADSSSTLLPILYIAQYKQGNLVKITASEEKAVKPNTKDYISVTADAVEDAEVKAFLWSRNSFAPLTLQAFYETSGDLLKGITVNGEILEGFDADNESYSINLNAGDVVPVVKGIGSHSGVYTTTAYSFVEGSSVAGATVTASDGSGNSKVYSLNFKADGALIGHLSDYKDIAGGMTYEEYYEYSWGVSPEGAALMPPENTSHHSGPLETIPEGEMIFFKIGEDDALAESLWRNTALTSISKASGLENAYYIKPTVAYTWWHHAPEWMYRAFVEPLGTFPEDKQLWYSFTVNAPCEVILLVDKEMTLGFAEEDDAWEKSILSEGVYTGITKSYNEDMSGNTIMYSRKYNKGDTVSLYNLYGSEGQLYMNPNEYITLPYMTLIKF